MTIQTAGTNYLLGEGQTNLKVTFQGRASSKWYIRKFAGGFENRQDMKYIRVIRQNGMQEATKQGLIFRRHPKVNSGDQIVLSYISPEEKAKMKREVKPLDWDKLSTKMLSLFTVLALIQAYVK